MKIVILAAGIGSRLENPLPKPLIRLTNNKTILVQQIENITTFFSIHDIVLIVGFKKDLIMESFPELIYIYNQNFDQTNTSKSLLKALQKYSHEGVLWFNGDVVFETNILKTILPYIKQDISFVCVNTAKVGEEEIKYTLNKSGYIKELSKQVKNGIGEALGINFISSKDIKILIHYLEECDAQDYFEKGIELAIEQGGIDVKPIDISEFKCMEIDFEEDLQKANEIF